VQCTGKLYGAGVIHAVVPRLLEVRILPKITRYSWSKITRPKAATRGQAQVATLAVVRQFFLDQTFPDCLKKQFAPSSRAVVRGADLDVGLGGKKVGFGRHQCHCAFWTGTTQGSPVLLELEIVG
jgi:hypothetical protein